MEMEKFLEQMSSEKKELKLRIDFGFEKELNQFEWEIEFIVVKFDNSSGVLFKEESAVFYDESDESFDEDDDVPIGNGPSFEIAMNEFVKRTRGRKIKGFEMVIPKDLESLQIKK